MEDGAFHGFLEIVPIVDAKTKARAYDAFRSPFHTASASRVEVYKPGGQPWGTVSAPDKPTGMSFGGEDMKTLYISTEGTKIWEINTTLPGISE
jgi:hypothetical protein